MFARQAASHLSIGATFFAPAAARSIDAQADDRCARRLGERRPIVAIDPSSLMPLPCARNGHLQDAAAAVTEAEQQQRSPMHGIRNPGAWLSRSIRNCQTPAQLSALLHSEAPALCGGLNHIHVAAALTSLAHMQLRLDADRWGASAGAEEEGQREGSRSEGGGAGGRCVWGSTPPRTRSLLLDQLVAQAPAFGPRQAANALWAASRLGGFFRRRASDKGAQGGVDAAFASSPGREEEEASLASEALGALFSASAAALPLGGHTPQELACSVSAVARLLHNDGGNGARVSIPVGWLEAFRAACRTAGWLAFSRQELSMVLWAMATLGWSGEIGGDSSEGLVASSPGAAATTEESRSLVGRPSLEEEEAAEEIGSMQGPSPPGEWLMELLMAQASQGEGEISFILKESAGGH